MKNTNSQGYEVNPLTVSCCPQLIQCEEVGDGAAVAAGEQRAALHSPAGVGGQHRALEEAILSLQGGERAAEGQGREHTPRRAAPPSAAPTTARSLGSLQLSGCVCQEMELGFGREVDGEFRQLLLPSAHSRQGRSTGAAASPAVPCFGIWEAWCQQGMLAGVRNQEGSKRGAAIAYPFQNSLKYSQIWMSRR